MFANSLNLITGRCTIACQVKMIRVLPAPSGHVPVPTPERSHVGLTSQRYLSFSAPEAAEVPPNGVLLVRCSPDLAAYGSIERLVRGLRILNTGKPEVRPVTIHTRNR